MARWLGNSLAKAQPSSHLIIPPPYLTTYFGQLFQRLLDLLLRVLEIR